MSILTDADRELLPAALRANRGFHLATEWYFNWKPLDYQYLFHHVEQPNCTWIGAIATGKTTAVAASYSMDCLTIPGFRALNTSISARQAELPFEMLMGWLDENPRLEHMVKNVKLRPYPLVEWNNGSVYSFRTMGNDARLIRGEEYDRVNVDEVGYMINDYALRVLRGRLRGVRPDGSPRMARMDVVGSPTSLQWLQERFYRGWPLSNTKDLFNYYSIRTTTYDNTYLTKRQIELMEADYPPNMIDVELGAQFPDFGFGMFPASHIGACTDVYLNDQLNEAVRTNNGKVKKGFTLNEDPRQGIVKFEFPVQKGHRYVLAGDPGVDNPPRRNAPVVGVMDVSTEPHSLVYFDWVFGNGSYMPFIDSFKYAINKYRPVLKGLDATGPQKALDELAFENHGIAVDKMHFGTDKSAILNDLSFSITGHKVRFPMVKGIHEQMVNYSREKDKKLAQDIVMMLGMLSHLSRYAPESAYEEGANAANNYRSRRQRSRRIRRR